MMTTKVSNQVKLPLSVAVEVVMQGIRIRLGRSVVTITGVVCGIAFFMSILTGQIIKQGVAAEDERRESVERIQNFMASEMPVLRDRKLALLGSGTLDEVETRVLEQLFRNGLSGIKVLADASPTPLRQLRNVEVVRSIDALTADVTAILLMGAAAPPVVDWQTMIAQNSGIVIGTTLGRAQDPPVSRDHLVALAREFTPEELAKRALEVRQQRFRSVWITVISLLVTVIGISNAMLMSVTERFREIGTMKCLGALSAFIRRIFILESSLMGFVGGLLGAIVGALFSTAVYTVTYGAGLVFASLQIMPIIGYGVCSLLAGVLLSIIAALYPAKVASNMVPATALRSTV